MTIKDLRVNSESFDDNGARKIRLVKADKKKSHRHLALRTELLPSSLPQLHMDAQG